MGRNPAFVYRFKIEKPLVAGLPNPIEWIDN